MSGQAPVVIIGAGAIGGFVAALLHEAGAPLRLLLRESPRAATLREVLGARGLSAACSLDPGFRAHIPADRIPEVVTTDGACLANCSCILVATKRTANAEVVRQLQEHGVTCPVLFLQNGLRVCEDMGCPAFEAIECVVTFNVKAEAEAGEFILSQSMAEAALVLDGAKPSSARLAQLFGPTPLLVRADADLPAVQRGKLLLNMTNAVNALSGVALLPMFMQREYRLVLAASISEAKAAYSAGGMTFKAAEAQNALLLRIFVTLLRSPQWFFAATLGRKLRGRGEGFASMAQDLMARRVPTEIDFLNGEIVRLGEKHGVPTPVNQKLVELVKLAETANGGCPGLSGAELLAAVGLAPM